MVIKTKHLDVLDILYYMFYGYENVRLGINGSPASSRVARWLSPKYWTLAVPMSVAQNIELFTHVLSGITIIFIPDKEPKYLTVRLNTGHLATLVSRSFHVKSTSLDSSEFF